MDEHLEVGSPFPDALAGSILDRDEERDGGLGRSSRVTRPRDLRAEQTEASRRRTI